MLTFFSASCSVEAVVSDPGTIAKLKFVLGLEVRRNVLDCGTTKADVVASEVIVSSANGWSFMVDRIIDG